MVTAQMKRLAKEQVSQTLETLGYPELAVRIEWEGRFTSRMGDAMYIPGQKFGRVRFSAVLWERATEKQRYETVVHEVCHIIVYYEFYKKEHPYWAKRPKSHGAEWKALMWKCGVVPERCHDVNTEGVGQKNKKVYCKCPKPHCITARKLTKIERGARYFCRRCGVLLTTTPQIKTTARESREESFRFSVPTEKPPLAASRAQNLDIREPTGHNKKVLYRSATLIVTED